MLPARNSRAASFVQVLLVNMTDQVASVRAPGGGVSKGDGARIISSTCEYSGEPYANSAARVLCERRS